MEKQILKKLALERAVVSSFHVKNDPMLAGFKVNSNNFQCDDDDYYDDDDDDDDNYNGYDY